MKIVIIILHTQFLNFYKLQVFLFKNFLYKSCLYIFSSLIDKKIQYFSSKSQYIIAKLKGIWIIKYLFYYKQKRTIIGSLKSMQSIEKYRTTLQKINLTFQNDIDYAYLMVGKSKCGMTSAAHYLSGNKLTGYKINGEPMVQIEDHQLKKQKIGKSYHTQTQVPNKFQIKLKNINQKIYLIDGPGFGSTHGALGILSTGYAHLKIFEKVKNIKFILCFKESDLYDNGSVFIETIKQFIGFFTNFEDIKNQIKSACSFLFTKTKDHQRLKNKLTHISHYFKTQLNQVQQKQIKEIITHMIETDKIFKIKQAGVGQIIQSSTVMNDVNVKVTQWLTRGPSKQQREQQLFSSLDMKPIKTSLIKQLQISCISGQKSKSTYVQLINYYKQMINKIFGLNSKSQTNIRSFLNTLAKDFMSQSSEFSLFVKMTSFIQRQTFHNGQNELGKELNQIKNNTISRTYEDIPLESYNLEVNTLRKTVKKYYALKNIQQINKVTQEIKNTINQFGYVLSWLNQIFDQVHKVALWYNRQSTVKQYFYELSQIIEELRYMQIIFQQDENKNKILSQICDISPSNYPYFYIIREVSIWASQLYCFQNSYYTSGQLLKLYTQRLDIVQLQQKGYVIDEYFVQWMFSEQEVDDQKCKNNMIILMERYSDMVLQRLELQQQSNGQRVNYPVIYTQKLKKQLFLNLYKARQWAQRLYFNHSKPQEDRFYTIKHKLISKNLAQSILHKKQYSLAIKYFDSVNMVSSACSTFEKWINFVENDDCMTQTERIVELIVQKLDYVKYLSQHFRTQNAIDILNEMLSDQRLEEQKLQQIGLKLMDLRKKNQILNKNREYASVLSSKQYFKKTNGSLQSGFKIFMKDQFYYEVYLCEQQHVVNSYGEEESFEEQCCSNYLKRSRKGIPIPIYQNEYEVDHFD